jgi:hypothetical protein
MPQFVKRNGVIWMTGSEACLCQPLKLLCIDLGGGVISARVMILKGLVDRDDVGRLSRCGREPSDRRQYEERDKSGLAARSRYNDFTPRHLSHGGGTIHGRKYGEKFPRRHGLKKPGRSNDFGVVLLSPTGRRPNVR